MDYRSLSNVLGILRLIKNSGNPNHTTADHIRTWASQHPVVSSTAILKVAGYVIEQVEEARVVIDQLPLSDEAKHGVHEVLEGMVVAFSLQALQSPPQHHIKNIPAAISSFVILLSAGGVPTETETPQEAIDLAEEVEKLMKEFDDGALDPIVRDIAKRHLQILATLLRHVNVFGLEAALATYFDLVFKLRRADANTTDEQKKKTQPLMEQIDKLQSKLGILDKAWNQGARWVGRAKNAALLLGFFNGS